ncbi:MAG: lytic transglycosylase domain-containing protein [Bacteroides sp.]|nr:lytic transglycosylase domain-containing protein [Bacteroides sp.]
MTVSYIRSNKRRRPRKKSIYTLAAALLLLLIAAVIGNTVYKAAREKYLLYNYPVKYEEIVEKYAEENRVDKFLIYAIIKTESNFDSEAVSEAGARGLMQIMDETFQWIRYRLGDSEDSEYDLMFDPEQNIRYGTYLIGYLLEYFGSMNEAVCAYHAGVGSVDSWLQCTEYSKDGSTLDTVPASDTKHYLKKIKDALKEYQKIYTEDNKNA